MAFEDTIDHYRELRASDALERRQRLLLRQLDIREIEKLGYYVGRLNGGYQVRIRWMDYWPSTGKWRDSIRKRSGSLQDGESLIELVKREVGEPGSVLAKKRVLAVKP